MDHVEVAYILSNEFTNLVAIQTFAHLNTSTMLLRELVTNYGKETSKMHTIGWQSWMWLE